MIHAQRTKSVNIVPPQAIVDDASWTTAEVDTKGWDYAEIKCYMGANDIAMTALAVTESDTTGSGHANVTGLIYGTSTDVTGSTSALPAADDDNKYFTFQIDLRKRKRFLDLTATNGNGSAGGFLFAECVLSRPNIGPESDVPGDQGYANTLRV